MPYLMMLIEVFKNGRSLGFVARGEASVLKPLEGYHARLWCESDLDSDPIDAEMLRVCKQGAQMSTLQERDDEQGRERHDFSHAAFWFWPAYQLLDCAEVLLCLM